MNSQVLEELMRRSVVLTGISRGLGAALFDVFADADDRVLGLSRNFTEKQRARALADPARIQLRETDLADPGLLPNRTELAAFLDAESVPTLIHNAAVVTPIGPVGTLDPVRIELAVSINLLAPKLLTNAFLAAFPPEVPRVDILFITSGAARRVIDGWSVYSATKAAGENFFGAVAEQFADDPRVRISVVNPGVMDTGMQAEIRAAEFVGQERYQLLHERGELPAPADVARRIVDEYLGGVYVAE